MIKLNLIKTLTSLALCTLASCVSIPQTLEQNLDIPHTEVNNYKFHSKIMGDSTNPKVIVVHGGPGADFNYLLNLGDLAKNHYVLFYDQRGNGLSPRVESSEISLEQNLKDLDALIDHFSPNQKVKLVGHSWGGMLVTGYVGMHPNKVSHAVVVEPGMLNQNTAIAFVEEMKKYQSFTGMLNLLGAMTVYPFVKKYDDHEGFDYVMTKMLNQNKPGKPYQCDEQQMPEASFKRGGFEVFNLLLRPIMDDPGLFKHDLTQNIHKYKGHLMLMSSDCSAIGYEFQTEHHLSLFPSQTVHLRAVNMGHNMLTLNPTWSNAKISEFFAK